MTLTQQSTIPVANLNDFIHGDIDAKHRFIDTVGSSLRDLGFFALSNHGITDKTIENAFTATEALFRLPKEVKEKYEIDGLLGDRGYTSFGKEQAVGAPVPDLKEFWHVGMECSPLPKNQTPNVWPSEVPEFKGAMSELFESLTTVSLELLKACALYLGEPENLLADTIINGANCLRAIHYPPIPETAPPMSIRAAAHEDINLITLLVQSTASGLELLENDGTWRPIYTLDGHIVVDTGDMLQRLTNGYLKATTHRVVNPDDSRERRFSMPFFTHPRAEVSLAALPSCLEKTGGVKLWRDCTAGEYLRERLIDIGLDR